MSETQSQPAPLDPEDAARASCYGLIARLFYAPPDEQLLGQLLSAPAAQDGGEATEQGQGLARAWDELREACRSAFPVRLEHEHTELFAAPGRTEVTPYLFHYTMRYESEVPLVALRDQLARWGLARRDKVSEPEDHIAAVCEVMRYAIAVQQRPHQEQREFFERYVSEGAFRFCDAVSASPKASFYRLVAAYSRAFFEIERETFRTY